MCVYECVCVEAHQTRPDQTDMIQFVFPSEPMQHNKITNKTLPEHPYRHRRYHQLFISLPYSLRVLILRLQYVYIVKSSWISQLSMRVRPEALLFLSTLKKDPSLFNQQSQAKCVAQGYIVMIYEWRDGLGNVSPRSEGTKDSI